MKVLPKGPIRLPRLRSYVPDASDPRIFWFNSERADILQEIVRRIMERYEADEAVELVIGDAAYHEIRRLEGRKDDSAKKGLEHWRGILRRVGRMSSEGKHETLREITAHMAKDVAGNFDPRVYKFASRFVPGLLTGVMNPSNLLRNMLDSGGGMDELVTAQGPIDKIRHLQRKGCVVLVPTHSSNLDSLAIAWALYREELSPVVYGAGKNLFTNPIISFFMHNLGAYRVDRRIRAGLYKDVLKSYSSIMIERGFHSLFFPGGTRSRSGAIEQRLKLGLAGTGVEAFSRNQVRGVDRPVYFVPATINYELVLEAETLVDDHLKEAGRARYIIEDDEFSRVERWLSFFKRLGDRQTASVIRFSDPIDPFCNPVDDDGRSLTPQGKTLDPGGYVSRRGSYSVDHARDAAYTKDLGTAIAKRYVTDTVVMGTQLVAHVLFRRLCRATPGLDLFARLRHRGDIAIPMEELREDVGMTRDALVALARRGGVHVHEPLESSTPEEIIDGALGAWAGYHQRVIARTMGGSVIAEDPNLLLFYQNRLRLFACDIAGGSEADNVAAREIAAMEGGR